MENSVDPDQLSLKKKKADLHLQCAEEYVFFLAHLSQAIVIGLCP